MGGYKSVPRCAGYEYARPSTGRLARCREVRTGVIGRSKPFSTAPALIGENLQYGPAPGVVLASSASPTRFEHFTSPLSTRLSHLPFPIHSCDVERPIRPPDLVRAALERSRAAVRRPSWSRKKNTPRYVNKGRRFLSAYPRRRRADMRLLGCPSWHEAGAGLPCRGHPGTAPRLGLGKPGTAKES